MPPPSQPPDVEGRRGRSAPSPEDEEDAALIRKAALGDRGAFETLYGRLAPSLMAFAYHLTRDRELSEDAVQEAFLRAWQAAPRFDPSRGKARTWLFQIAKHWLWNESQKWSRERGAGGEGGGSAAAATLPAPGPAAGTPPGAEVQAALGAALADLSDLLREAFVLVRLSGLSYAETAEVLSVPEGTVKSRMAAAEAIVRDRLRRFL